MERAAFEPLLIAILPKIYQVAQMYAAKYHCTRELQDIVQSALLKMLRFADHYDPEKGSLLPWACVIVVNTIKDLFAQSNLHPDIVELNDTITDQMRASIDRNPENELEAQFIFANINEETRLFFEGYSYAEIAALRGFKSKSSIRERINACANRLEGILCLKIERGRRKRTVVRIPDKK